MERDNPSETTAQTEEFRVAVAYADTVTRDRAITLCDHLMARFANELNFLLSWWRFDYLTDPQIAEQATAAALVADMIVFSEPAGILPPEHVQKWVQTWVAQRLRSSGALVALVGTPEQPQTGPSPAQLFLRKVAERAGMDFFPQHPESLHEGKVGSLEEFIRRSEGETTFIRDMLRRSSPPGHWGINE